MRGVAVQELLGHATIENTMRYAHLSPAVKRDAVQLLDDAVHSRLDSGSFREPTLTANGARNPDSQAAGDEPTP
jgi:hypothetical protein